jgi:hypothetical protein
MAKKLPSVPKKAPKLRRPTKSQLTSFRAVISYILVLSIVMLGVSGYYWYKNIFTDPDRVFYGMIEKNLSTPSISRTVNQQERLRSVEQTYRVFFQPVPYTESVTTIDQVGLDRQKSTVVTKSIGTKDDDFVQYKSINVPSLGNKEKLSDIEGKWAKRVTSKESGQQPQFLTEAMFMFIPFGSMSPQQRDDLVNLMKENETYTYSTGKLELEGIRPVMTYDVRVKPEALVEVLAEYAKQTGVGDLSQLNPEEYKNSGDVQMRVTVDVLSRHLKTIDFDDSRKETYTGYGLREKLVLPENPIAIDELQNRLQALQQTQ